MTLKCNILPRDRETEIETVSQREKKRERMRKREIPHYETIKVVNKQ